MLVSVLLHVIVFFALDHMKIALGFESSAELRTAPVNIRRVEVSPPEPERIQTPEDVVIPPEDTAALLDMIDLLDALPDVAEIDIIPSALEPEFELQMSSPAMAGDPEAFAPEVGRIFDIDSALPDFGREMESLPAAAIGQITVDPGSLQTDDAELGAFTAELLKQGANGEIEVGTLDGVSSLNELLELPPDLLLARKTLLPSDLLFDFNSAELRESAKVGLMKLGLLIDKNPQLYCWIEGHSDLIGSDNYNLELSQKRAAAVKEHLVKSMRMDPERIIARGFGRTQPIVTTGTAEEQAPNRRVEIRMRQTPPDDQAPTATEESAPPPRAVLVRPNRQLPPEMLIEEPPATTPAPRATPVEERSPPRATPVEEPATIPRALPVPEEPAGALRALPVE
jgi:OmpA-OmpF porin, OOP family